MLLELRQCRLVRCIKRLELRTRARELFQKD